MIPKTTQIVMDIIAKHLWEQNRKGIQKYGTTIDEASNSEYNWNVMALQEVIDCIQYVVKENMKIKEENLMLSSENKHLRQENKRLLNTVKVIENKLPEYVQFLIEEGEL